MLVTLFIILIIASIFGFWGVAVSIYTDAIEEPFVDPLLTYLSRQGAIGGAIYLVVCTFFMTVRRAITYAPAWAGLYMLMSIAGYPTQKIYDTLYFFILCAGIIKMSTVTRDYYYPNNKFHNSKEDDAYLERLKDINSRLRN